MHYGAGTVSYTHLYLFSAQGELQTTAGWVETSDGKYYLKSDGSFAMGAEQIDGKWYGFDKNGLKVESGFLEWNGKYYWAPVSYTHLDVYKRQSQGLML